MTIQNFILEQEIGTSDVVDVYIEQALSEMEVACAIAESYMKQEILLEYATETGSTVYMEDEFSTGMAEGKDQGKDADWAKPKFKDRAKSAFKNAGKNIKKAIAAAIKAVRLAFFKVYDFFTKVNFGKLRDKVKYANVDNQRRDQQFPFPKEDWKAIEKLDIVVTATAEFLEMVEYEDNPDAYHDRLDKYKNEYDSKRDYWADTISVNNLVARLDDFDKNSKMFKELREVAARFSKIETKLNPDTDRTIDPAIIRDYATWLTKSYTESAKAVKKLVTKLGKENDYLAKAKTADEAEYDKAVKDSQGEE